MRKGHQQLRAIGNYTYRYLVTTNKTHAKQLMKKWREQGYGARYITDSVWVTVAKIRK